MRGRSPAPWATAQQPEEADDDRAPASAAIDLPDFGVPDVAPGAARRASTPTASSGSGRARGARGYDRLVVYADREHSANLSCLTGFDPRFEEAILVVGARRRCRRSSSGNECWGMARRRAAARCAVTCSRT